MKKFISFGVLLGSLSVGGCAAGPDFSKMSPQQIQAYAAYRKAQSDSMDTWLASTNKPMPSMPAPMSTPRPADLSHQNTYAHCVTIGTAVTCN